MGPIVILDVDGTLVDTNYHHALAWYRAFRRFDVTLPLARLHHYMGMGGDQLVSEVAGKDFEGEHGDDVRDVEKEEYEKLIGEVAVLDHAKELIGALRDAGCRVILASSAKEEEIEHYVELLGADDVPFTMSDDVGETKPDPELVEAALEKIGREGDALMIGDTTWDCEASGRAGVPMVGVLMGGFSDTELREAGAKRIYAGLREIAEDLDALLAVAEPVAS